MVYSSAGEGTVGGVDAFPREMVPKGSDLSMVRVLDGEDVGIGGLWIADFEDVIPPSVLFGVAETVLQEE